MKTLSYFRPDGSYRGSFNQFEPSDFPGSRLHADGISLIKTDGRLFRQVNPYVSKTRYTSEGLTEVEGECSGAWRFRDGVAEKIPEADRPKPPPAPLSAEELFDVLKAKGVLSLSDLPGPKR